MKVNGLHIALISTDYPPLCTSASVQMRDLAQEMLRQGHKPVVIVPTIDLKTSWTCEDLDGVQVVRLAAPRTRNMRYLRRTFSELLLPFLIYFRLRKGPFGSVPWDLIAWYSPTIFFGPLVWFMKRTSKAYTYLILRDIFPEWAHDIGLLRKGLPYYFLKNIANLQYAVADAIGVQTHSNLSYLIHWDKRYGKKVEVLPNWQAIAPNIGSSINISTTSLAGRKILVYIGNMGIAQGMDILIDLARSLVHRNDIGFVFVGRGSEVPRLKSTIYTNNLTNTLFFDEIDSREMQGLLAQCYIGLIALDRRHKTHNIPGKFLTYLLAGLPVLACINPGTDLAYLIKESDIGRAYEGESIAELSKLLQELTTTENDYVGMSSRARLLGATMFSPEKTVKQILSSIC